MATEEGDRQKVYDREERHMVHVHMFTTETDVADQHQHVITGVSAPARVSGTSHVHRLRGRTTFYSEDGDGHWHWFDVITGPAVEVPDGNHVHYFSGVTSTDDGHAHNYAGVTGLAPDDADDYHDDDCDDKGHKYGKYYKREDEKA